ncbi:fibronectin type III domain-containing protein [Parapedobacter tibetensis]|uniref:fibronectin type III domain-containing protein n=1 Tax=Parapedobacter tibetensis TaxID=2972951 RepID=UPI00214DB328|nr:fibronectin type III domain-containing protein [Parapedobacter tibetensis]
MRTIIYKIVYILLLGTVVFGWQSCKKEQLAELEGEPPRIFRPILKGAMVVMSNYVQIEWQNNKGVSRYRVDLSVDTFKTIDLTVEVDTTLAIIESLKWDQLYQVQVTAYHATDASKNSHPANLGEFKTERFPSIVERSSSSDIGITSVLFKWRNEGEPVTAIKVFRLEGEMLENETLEQEVPLTQTDIGNMYVLVTGLTGASDYRVELYSGETFRGANVYRTKNPVAGEVVDLQAADPTTVDLATVINDAPSGATILLKKGGIYEMSSSLAISKSISIRGGDNPLETARSKVFFGPNASNFNIASGSAIDLIALVDLELYTNDGTGKYIFNPNTTGNIQQLVFSNCYIHTVRGVARFRGGLAIEEVIMDNCLIYNVGGYGVVNVDDNNTTINNISILNSTISNVEVFIASKSSASGKIVLHSNTFYNAIQSNNRYLIDYSNASSNTIGGIDVINNIFGRPKASNATPPTYDINGIRSNTGVSINSSNNFSTSDFLWRENEALLYPEVTPYNKTSADIFTDPDNFNFKIKDNGFPGRLNSGDPRWRM